MERLRVELRAKHAASQDTKSLASPTAHLQVVGKSLEELCTLVG